MFRDAAQAEAAGSNRHIVFQQAGQGFGGVFVSFTHDFFLNSLVETDCPQQ
jgi:hypothetical protein